MRQRMSEDIQQHATEIISALGELVKQHGQTIADNAGEGDDPFEVDGYASELLLAVLEFLIWAEIVPQYGWDRIPGPHQLTEKYAVAWFNTYKR